MSSVDYDSNVLRVRGVYVKNDGITSYTGDSGGFPCIEHSRDILTLLNSSEGGISRRLEVSIRDDYLEILNMERTFLVTL